MNRKYRVRMKLYGFERLGEDEDGRPERFESREDAERVAERGNVNARYNRVPATFDVVEVLDE